MRSFGSVPVSNKQFPENSAHMIEEFDKIVNSSKYPQ